MHKLKNLFAIYMVLLCCIILGACSKGSDNNSDIKPSQNSSKDITAYSINNIAGTINGTDISVNLPSNTDLTKLTAKFETNGISVKIKDIVQKSAETENNFSKPVTYTVTAQDGSTKNYTVTVTKNQKIPKFKDITAYSINNIAGTINGTDISVTLPFDTDLTKLKAKFETNGISVEINGIVQKSEETENDFSNPITYTVTAQDGSTKNYTVTVNKTIKKSDSKDIIAYSINNIAGIINGTEIAVTLPLDTDVSKLTAKFQTNGLSVKINGIDQISEVTENDFSSPITYTVTAEDGTSKSYIVNIIIKNIFAGQLTKINEISTKLDINMIKISPNGDFAYALSSSNTIEIYKIDKDTGDLTFSGRFTIFNTGDMTISSDSKFAYVISNHQINMYSIDSSSGELKVLSPATIATGTFPSNIAISPDGSFAYVSNNGSSNISMYSIDSSTGELTALSPATIDTSKSPDYISIRPDGKFAYVTSSDTKSISMYSIDGSSGQLKALSPNEIQTNTSSGPWNMAISPNGKFAYVSSLLSAENNISMYSIDSDSGLLKALSPEIISAGRHPSSIVITPNGQFAYVANTQSPFVSMYSIDEKGKLTPLSPEKVDNSSNIKGIDISPDGKFAYVVNNDQYIHIYKIHQ